MKAIVAETVESDSKRESASDRRGESVYNTRIQSDRQNTHTTTAQQYTFKYTHILSHTHTHSVRGNCPPKASWESNDSFMCVTGLIHAGWTLFVM